MSTHSHAFRPVPMPGLRTLTEPMVAFGRRVWGFLEAAGERRARRELNRLAQGYAISQPQLAAQLREAAAHTTR